MGYSVNGVAIPNLTIVLYDGRCWNGGTLYYFPAEGLALTGNWRMPAAFYVILPEERNAFEQARYANASTIRGVWLGNTFIEGRSKWK